MANAIDVIIRAAWQGRGDVERARRDIEKLGPAGRQGAQGIDEVSQASRRSGPAIGSLVSSIGAFTAIAGTATLAARQLFRAVEAGAGLELTAMRFENLAASIGTTGDALRQDLRSATSGMLSDAQAMALATDLIGLGLANNAEQATRLAGVVSELNADMNQLVLTLSNQTTMRFDALGVSVAGFDDKLNALKGTMSDEEAFLMAFLDQAEESIERAGGAADTTAGDIARLKADWADLNDEIERFLALGFGPLLAAASGRTGREFVERARAIVGEAESVDDLVRGYEALNDEFNELLSKDIQAAGIATEGFIDASGEILRALANMTDSAEEFDREARRIFNNRQLGSALRDAGVETTEAFFDMTRATAEYERTVAAAEGADRKWTQATEQSTDALRELDDVLQDVQRNLDVYAQQLAEIDAYESRREGISGREAVTAQNMAELEADFNLQRERTDLFLSFQADLNDINDREEERRLQITEQYEEQRTDLIADYNQRRAEEEADWLRRRAKQAADLERDIAGVREDSAEREADLRANANRRLQDLEEDHLDRMREITENAEVQLADAASRLDARAVANIQRNRDKALADEVARYQEQRSDILEELDRRIEAEREAAEERIEELKEFHEERQAEEEEDRRIRLERMEKAHQDQLRELKKQEDKRLLQLKQQATAERNERERQYIEERYQLRDHWDDRMELERQWQQAILQQEAAWWQQRAGQVPGDTGGPTPDPDPDPGGGGDDGGDGSTNPGDTGTPWTRTRMEHTAFRIANPSTSEEAYAWQRFFRGLTDAQLAAWIEQHSDIDVPGFAMGGSVAHDLFALVGERGPELVKLPGGSHVYDAQTSARMMGGVQTGDISITVNEARRPGQTGREVRDELIKVLREVTG